ncbi:2-oxoacid:acceptor oxidoreductase family protein [Fusibacter sp. 3D3]|uniref:2-oxoacid:acceptor oxidoreductase family protein n=1 Tax=Fusibacter sp. 3D3 TaxID=1048380 RepID=UPI000853C0AD|nr:2-oxoacid:acceptor oxidoreductase family protein [Fusibacter sp. 3D3]GAU77562.1 pyruvate:ferredoxin oxidoreductase gamma subunit [Fusibacter sp. 3D3]
MFEIRWHGRGGQGSFTGAKLLGVAASIYDEKFAQAFPSFGPERRGAPVLGFNRISNEKITDRSELTKCDYIVFLDDTLFDESVLSDLKNEDALILINTQRVFSHKNIRGIDATKIALEILGIPISNTVMLGYLARYAKEAVRYQACMDAIRASMKPSIAEKNIEAFKCAYEQGGL